MINLLVILIFKRVRETKILRDIWGVFIDCVLIKWKYHVTSKESMQFWKVRWGIIKTAWRHFCMVVLIFFNLLVLYLLCILVLILNTFKKELEKGFPGGCTQAPEQFLKICPPNILLSILQLMGRGSCVYTGLIR